MSTSGIVDYFILLGSVFSLAVLLLFTLRAVKLI
ncbi:MAG: hypothetical protein LVT47_11470 [Cyanobacteria bacterium LVE1205-1]|jgi:hypothetical protein